MHVLFNKGFHRVALLAFILPTILSFSFAYTGYGQNKGLLDSLTRRLSSASDSERVLILSKISGLYFTTDLQQSLRYAQEAFNLSTQLGQYEGGQSAFNQLVLIYRKLGLNAQLIELALQNLKLSTKANDTTGIIQSYLVLGNNHADIFSYPEAKTYYLRALPFCKQNSVQRTNILNFLGRVYGKLGRYDSGHYYVQAALNQELANPQPGPNLSYMYNNLAELWYYRKEYTKAIEYYDLALNLSKDKKSPYGTTFTLLGLALVYKAFGEDERSIKFAKEAIQVSNSNSFLAKTAEAYEILYTIYKGRGDHKKALESFRQYKLYEDSVFNTDRLKHVESLKVIYETDQRVSENELLRTESLLKDAQLRQQQTMVWISIGTVLFLFVLSIVLYRSKLKGKKINVLLKGHNIDLEKKVEERTKELLHTNVTLVKQNNQLEQFGYITAHNLRGPVARILGLTNLISATHFNPQRDQVLIEKLHTSTKELDTIIHDLNSILDIKKGIHASLEEVNLKDRFDAVVSILQDKINESNATIVEEISVQTCLAIPAYIQSIFYNLLSNSIKYRDSVRTPLILVKVVYVDDKIVLTVEDNGKGIDLEKHGDKLFTLYQRFHHHVEGKGLGLFLVKTQVEALNGSIEVASQEKVGTTFKIYFPRIVK